MLDKFETVTHCSPEVYYGIPNCIQNNAETEPVNRVNTVDPSSVLT
jgi:hypothetical protein